MTRGNACRRTYIGPTLREGGRRRQTLGNKASLPVLGAAFRVVSPSRSLCFTLHMFPEHPHQYGPGSVDYSKAEPVSHIYLPGAAGGSEGGEASAGQTIQGFVQSLSNSA
jgi:hypothetical protein